MAVERLDWPALMRLGLGALHLASADFWAMTPGELRLAVEGAGLVAPVGVGAMEQSRLAELMAAFPDGASVGGTGCGNPSAGSRAENTEKCDE